MGNGRHMAQTAAHLVDHVIPPAPVRPWVISLPQRLRGVLGDRPKAVAAVTTVFLDEIEMLLLATHLRYEDRFRCDVRRWGMGIPERSRGHISRDPYEWFRPPMPMPLDSGGSIPLPWGCRTVPHDQVAIREMNMKHVGLFLAVTVLLGTGLAVSRTWAADPAGPSRSMEVIGSEARDGERTTIRDESGRVVGSATTQGGRTTFRDSSGRTVGSATQSGNRTTFRDSSGRMTGSATNSGDRTTFRDSSGRATGSAAQSGSRSQLRDGGGRATGSVQRSGERSTFRDSSGRTTGSATTNGRKR